MSDNVESASAVGAAPRRPARASFWLRVARLVAFMLVVGLTVFIYLIRDRAEQLAAYGYPGIFILSILANATIILPAPGLAVVFVMGGVFSPWGVGLTAAAGATLGELSGYLAGFGGQAIVENRPLYNRFEGWMKRYGPPTVAVLAFVPSPFFDLAGISAGALRMPIPVFLAWCFVGKLGKMLLFAFAGTYSVDWLIRLVS